MCWSGLGVTLCGFTIYSAIWAYVRSEGGPEVFSRSAVNYLLPIQLVGLLVTVLGLVMTVFHFSR